MTQKEWNERQKKYEKLLISRNPSILEIDFSRSCWWCRDTSLCDESCFNFIEYNKKEDEKPFLPGGAA